MAFFELVLVVKWAGVGGGACPCFAFPAGKHIQLTNPSSARPNRKVQPGVPGAAQEGCPS